MTLWGSQTSVRVADLRRYRPIIVTDTAGSALVLASFLYMSIIRFAQFVVLRFRADVDKEVEILVLRHQLAVLRRQSGKVKTEADRAGLALLSRLVGAEYSATLCHLGVFMDESAEPISSDDFDVGVDGVR